MKILERAGAKVVVVDRIHHKTLCMDNRWIVDGSFNWFSAIRDPAHPYQRQERSMRYSGKKAEKMIAEEMEILRLAA